MKKLIYPLFGLAALAMTNTSCSDENNSIPAETAEMTTFKVALQGATGSRTAGDGMTVNKLYYAVYDKAGTKVIVPANAKYGEAAIVEGKVEVTLPLMKSEQYDIVFWAQNADANYYSFDELTEITVNYDGLNSNDEKRDAFFNTLDDFRAEGKTQEVKLYRPFGQLNVATAMDDWNEALRQYQANGNTDYPVKYSEVTVSKLATTFNAKTGEATGDTEATVTFGKKEILDESIETNDAEYKLLAMNYLLMQANQTPTDIKEPHQAAPEDGNKAIVDLIFTLWKDNDNQIVKTSVPAVPIQRNYRTNILGSFLTGDKSQFNIVVDPIFDGDHNPSLDIVYEDVNKIARIYTLQGLKDFRDIVNGDKSRAAASQAFKGWTICLENDIDLNKEAWTPIGKVDSKFEGIFDGKGKTISNLNVSLKEQNGVGLFGRISSATVKNVKIQGATVEGMASVGAVVGHAVASKITDCYVDDATLNAYVTNGDEGNNVGAIVGYISDENNSTVSNNVVNNVRVFGYKDLAAIAGTANAVKGNMTVENNKVTNSVIVAERTGVTYNKETEPNVGAIVGRNLKATLKDNVEENVTYGVKVSTAEELNTAIADTKVQSVVLADGTYQGLFSIGRDLTVLGLNKDNAIIDGMVFANNEATLTLKNLTLTNTDNTLIDKDGRGNKGSILSEYQASIIAENCTFNAAYDYIAYLKSSDTNNYHKFINCTFNCNGMRAIHSKTNITVDNCTFIDQYRYSLHLRGQGENVNTETKVIFTNNTVLDACKTSGKSYGTFIEITANQPFKYVTFDIENNAGNLGFTYDDTKDNSAAYLSEENFKTCYFDGINFLPESIVALKSLGNIKEYTKVDLFGDVTVFNGSMVHAINETGAITLDGNGNTIISTFESGDVISWGDGTVSSMSTIFAPLDGSKVTVSNLNFEGTMTALSLGKYIDSKSNRFNTELNEVKVINAETLGYNQGLAPAVVCMGTVVLNNCQFYGTKLSELYTGTNNKVYDFVMFDYSKVTINGGKIGTMRVWKRSNLTIDQNAQIDCIALNSNYNEKGYGIVIKSGVTVNTIDLSSITNKTQVVITIEDGATIGKIIANGVEYASIEDFKNDNPKQ